jgi:menaquinone-dependent protoporphyrinogen oxidase
MRKTLPGLSTKKYPKHRTILSCIFFFMVTVIYSASVAESTVLPDLSCGSANVGGKKVLVAYDSKHGSTSMIAEKVGDVLCENGFQVDIRPALIIEDISTYDAIVLGSPVYYANFLPGALQFLERHRAILAVKDVAVFAISTSVDKETGMVNEHLSNLVFSSVLNKFPEIQILEPMGLLPGRMFFKEVFPVEIINLKQADFEEAGNLVNFDFVRSWTEEIAALLK